MEQPEADLAVIKEWREKCFHRAREESSEPLLKLFSKGFDTISVFASSTSKSASILRSIDGLEDALEITSKYYNPDSVVFRNFSFNLLKSFNLTMKIQIGNIAIELENREAALALIKDREKECYEHSNESDDPLFSLFTSAFGTMSVIASATDTADILHSLEFLESERKIALKYEKKDFDAIRHFSFGFVESFILMMRIQIKKSNSENRNPNMNDQMSNLPSSDIGDELIDVSDHEMPYLHSKSSIKKEEPVDLYEAVSNENTIPYGFDSTFNVEMQDNNEMPNAYPLNSYEPKDEFIDSLTVVHSDNQITLDATFNSKLPAENEINYNIPRVTIGNDLFDTEESMNDPVSDALKKGIDASKKCKGFRLSNTELECPKCDYRSRSVSSWINHLKQKHCTSPILAGLALRCECGHESFSNNHLRECDSNNYTVIHKSKTDDKKDNQGRIGESSDHALDATKEFTIDEKSEERPTRRVSKPLRYVESKEDSEDDSKCVPSSVSRKRKIDHRMSNDQAGKINQTDLECPECEYRSRSAVGFEGHLTRMHSKTLTQAGLSFLCDCGNESQSNGHVRKCEIANITIIRKRDGSRIETDKKRNIINKTDLECPECPYRSRSAVGFVGHFERMHDKTLTQAELALRCDCGNESQSYSHVRKCNIANVTLIRKKVETRIATDDEKVNEGGTEETTDNALDATKESIIDEKSEEGPPRKVSKPLRYVESMEDSEFVTGSMDQKRRKIDDGMSNGQSFDPNSTSKIFRVGKINQTELECPDDKCDYRSRSVAGWVQHLRKKHSTNPTRLSLTIVCGCGTETHTDHHVRKCDIANVTVIRKNDAPIRRLDLSGYSDFEPSKPKSNDIETSNTKDDDALSTNENSMSKGTTIYTPKESAKNAEVKNIKKILSIDPKSKKFTDDSNVSLFTPQFKQYMPRSQKTNDSNGKTHKHENDLNAANTNPEISKRNDTDLECPECEKRSKCASNMK